MIRTRLARFLLRGTGFAIVPREPNDDMRRVVWEAQYQHVKETRGHNISAEGVAELVSQRVNDPAQREQDRVAWRAMVEAHL